MSEYTSVFMRLNDPDKLIELAYGGRGSIYARIFENAPFNKIVQYSTGELLDSKEYLHRKIDEYNDSIVSYERRIREIGSWNNSIAEKTAAIGECYEAIDTLKDEIDTLTYGIHFIEFLDDIGRPIYAGVEVEGAISEIVDSIVS